MNIGVPPEPFAMQPIFSDKDIFVDGFQVFVIRAILGAVFAVVISRIFYPDTNLYYVAGLGVILVGLAYFAEYIRKRRQK